MRTLYLGLDVGGTKCAVVLGDGEGRVHERVEWASLAQRGPEAMISDLVFHAQSILSGQGARSVGVSIGGPLNAAQGVVHGPPNLPGWDGVPLRARLQDELDLPISVEHDAAACALAEYRWGAGRDAGRLGFLTCGSGFGVGLVFDGEPYYGTGGRSIEIGHVRYCDDGPVAFGKRGSFEAFAAGNSLPKLAAWKFPYRWGSDPPTAKELADLASLDDPDARLIIDLNATAVGDACALIGDLLFLDLMTIGSLGRYLGESWLEQVRQRCLDQVLPEVGRNYRIESAALGQCLQDCAALVAAVRADPFQP